ncbi:MAG: hypothetical protein GTO55_02675 [Armatimonadetes bacterium]|nr:hypothetical protein [Armatimonadota bacterium]NIM23184.1 hypothetical protein [Armatimonadota bacterium]NIM67052.1 hypothetical protein [Armatimonadota bacterium]NIM75586.1 hypothetical protein [Armatimonadota bacterium]NIN05241.1 hypothetical protein [Armatimonadota bacterium]
MKAAVSARVVCLMAAVMLTITSALVQARSLWTPPPLSEMKKDWSAGTESFQRSQSRQTVVPFNVKIILPTDEKALRGVVDVRAEGVELGGYAVFRIDGEFAYATFVPYTMRWDTAGLEDGEHEIHVAAYGADRQLTGYGSKRVRVRNRILGAVPAEGISLQLRTRKGETIVRNVEGKAEVTGLDPQLTLPASLQGISGRLYARMSQSILSIDDTDNSANLRTSVRLGMLSTNGIEKELEEKGHYGIASLMTNGLELPPPPGSTRPRIGLGEVSLAVPVGLVQEGMTWTSPMRVIPTLAQRNSVQVEGSHTFDGVWWMKGRRCARISSIYDIDEVYLSAARPAPVALAVFPGYVSQFTFMPGGGTPPGVGKVGGKQDPQRSARRGQSGTRRSGRSARPRGGATGGGRTLRAGRTTASRRTRITRPSTLKVPTGTLKRLARSPITARLTGVSGDRTTWIDIDKGIVVRVEDHIAGTLVILDADSGSTNASLFTPSGMPGSGIELTASMGRGRPGGGGRSAGGMRSSRGGRGTSRVRTSGGRRGTGGRSSGTVRRRIVRSTPTEQIELPALQRLPYSLTMIIEIAY